MEPLVGQPVGRAGTSRGGGAARAPSRSPRCVSRVAASSGVSPGSIPPAGISQPHVSVMNRCRHNSSSPRSGSCTTAPAALCGMRTTWCSNRSLARDLDVDEREADPLALVQRPLTVHRPAHGPNLRWPGAVAGTTTRAGRVLHARRRRRPSRRPSRSTASDGAPAVCDPACGDGAFLLAAAELLARAAACRATVVARDLLWGCDIDPAAVAATRDAIVDVVGGRSGRPPGGRGRADDGRHVARPVRRRRRQPAVPEPTRDEQRCAARRCRLRSTRSPARTPTRRGCSSSSPATSCVRADGSCSSSRSRSSPPATPHRCATWSAPSLEGLWWCDELLFDASVRVCAPVLGRRVRIRAPMVRPRRVRDRGRRPPAIVVERARPVRRSRADLATPGRRPRHVVDTRALQRLADIATATAGFRDEYYGLRPAVLDEPDGDLPLLVTSGLVDVGRSPLGRAHDAVRRTALSRIRGCDPAGSPVESVVGCASASSRRSWSRRRPRSSKPRSTSTASGCRPRR